MKKDLRSHSDMKGSVSRREFLAQSATAALAFTIVPRHVLGAGHVPPSDKVNIAFIGVGAQGLRVMLHFLREPDVQGVAVCDVNKDWRKYPQWDTHEFCNSVRKLLGVDSGWDWLSPDAADTTESFAESDQRSGRAASPARKLWMAYYGTQQRSGQYHGCAAYNDFRELLEKQQDSMPWLSARPITCTPLFRRPR